MDYCSNPGTIPGALNHDMHSGHCLRNYSPVLFYTLGLLGDLVTAWIYRYAELPTA